MRWPAPDTITRRHNARPVPAASVCACSHFDEIPRLAPRIPHGSITKLTNE